MKAPVTIAIVDDDTDLRDTLSDVVRDAGYASLPFAGAREALTDLRSRPVLPGLILLDLMMPGMSGWDFRREQLADPVLRDVPVVVVTASRDLARNPISANDVLHKPVDVETLLASIARHHA
ncbi:MAG TPA: response regulator [Anaeromyxobacteraceae bacterium]|nr:response regulator [Anaeromyxobacteraceae bacterium]